MTDDARQSPADIYLVILRSDVLRVHRVDPSLDVRAALEATRLLMLSAGWTEDQIARNDRYELEALDRWPPLTTQQIAASNRAKELAAQHAADADADDAESRAA